jgi:transcriptional regulator with XRE-family HTH domain
VQESTINLKILRHRVGITQRQLAEILQITASTLSQYETGKIIPSYLTLRKISDYFKVSLDDLFDPNFFAKEKIITKEIFVPDFLTRTIQKFLLSFPDYVTYVKKTNIFFDVLVDNDKITLQLLDNDKTKIEEISEYFSEFIGLATGRIKIDQIAFKNQQLSEDEKTKIRNEFQNEIENLYKRVDFLQAQNGMLLEKQNFLKELSIDLKSNQKINKSILSKVTSIKDDTSEINSSLAKINHIFIRFGEMPENLEKIINTVSKEQTDDLVNWIETSMQLMQIKELENFSELEDILDTMRSSEQWETKIKIAVPFINLLGVKIESEHKFNLKKYIKNIKYQTEQLVLKYNLYL